MKNYPKIKEAALNIAYDNGMIHRNTDEETFINEVEKVLNSYDKDLINKVEKSLSIFSKEELETVCNGVDEQISELLARMDNQRDIELVLDSIFLIEV